MEGFISESRQIKRILETIRRIAPYDATVLLTGESGVGKNCFADMLHEFSSRREAPYVSINCGAIPANLLESELFGYEKGAFTNASNLGKQGLIEKADHGTLFLDEIGELPLNLQVKLLTALQDKKITRVGAAEAKLVDFRLITATNKDLRKSVEGGEFRKDLYYRLNTLEIWIPPLRSRREDIPPLIHSFVERCNRQYNRDYTVTEEAVALLMEYSWPGNVRELYNIVESMLLTSDSNRITSEMVPAGIKRQAGIEGKHWWGKSLKEILEETEREVILEAYEHFQTTTRAAEALGISQASMSLKLKKYRNS